MYLRALSDWQHLVFRAMPSGRKRKCSETGQENTEPENSLQGLARLQSNNKCSIVHSANCEKCYHRSYGYIHIIACSCQQRCQAPGSCSVFTMVFSKEGGPGVGTLDSKPAGLQGQALLQHDECARMRRHTDTQTHTHASTPPHTDRCHQWVFWRSMKSQATCFCRR